MEGLLNWNMWIGPIAVAAVISALVAFFIGTKTVAATLKTSAERIKADLLIAENKLWSEFDAAGKKLLADEKKAMTDKAWADYELRRDAYIAFTKEVGVLFVDKSATLKSLAPHPDLKEFHRLARTIRIIGSDQVVVALNDLTNAIKLNSDSDELDKRYSDLFNSIRVDIRTIHSLPPEGTALGSDAFPIES